MTHNIEDGRNKKNIDTLSARRQRNRATWITIYENLARVYLDSTHSTFEHNNKLMH